MIEDDMAGCYHQCNGHELGQTLGDGEGQGGLARCSPWHHRVRHEWATEQQTTMATIILNWRKIINLQIMEI